ncbi:MAG: ABC transporter ATP-binding protein, partial [Lachnospiraceae bacterium]|nr:ABC transporter ATP-binding protein [Lachnospiraceae bacterium]
MKQTLSDLLRALSILKKDYPFLKTVCAADAVSTALVPYVNLFFFARILRLLMALAFDSALVNAACMIGLTLLLSLLHRTCARKKQEWYPTMRESVSRQLSDKAFVMEYDNLEKTETLDKIRSAEYMIDGSGGFDQISETFTLMISSSVSILCSLLFIGRLFYFSANVFRFTDPWFYMLIAGFVLVTVFGARTASRMGALNRKMMEENAHVNAIGGYLINAGLQVSNQKDIRLYNIRGLLLDHYADYEKKSMPWYLSFARGSGRASALLSVVSNLYAAAGYLFVGMRALDGAIPVSDILLYTGALQRLTTAAETFVRSYMMTKMHTSYLLRFYEFIHAEPMHYTGTLPVEKRTDGDYELEFRDVSFTYPDTEEEVLSHVNLKFKVGQKLALVGRNGAGKSTIVKLLCRLYEPTSGEILLNGIDIRKYDYAEYTSIFAPVFQDFRLFSLPVRENITCGREEETTPHPSPSVTPSPQGEGKDMRMWEALEKAGIAARVREMKDGADTLLYHDNGEGVDVSGGEAQRLAIARAWYKDAPFLILDEPTAALDPLTEAQIYENFNELVGSKTA